MPYTESQRKLAFAELKRRKSGKKMMAYKGMSKDELMEYAHAPLKKKNKGNLSRKGDHA